DLSVFFFFFQAEDDIRDFHVTGVQSCALPIYGIAGAVLSVGFLGGRRGVSGAAPRGRPDYLGAMLATLALAAGGVALVRPVALRSEDRRVGKECSARWWPES